MKLFRVTTIVKEYSGYLQVPFRWFYEDRRPTRRPYADLIAGYDSWSEYAGYPEQSIEEMFSAAEAEQLMAYLDRHHGSAGVTTVEEVKLPIPMNTMSVNAIPVGRLTDCYMLSKSPSYSLPFSASARFDLRYCQVDRELEGDMNAPR